MSGTLVIRDSAPSDRAIWMPSGWVFDAVLHRVEMQLRRRDTELANILREAQTDMGGYGDISSLSIERFYILQQATKQAYLHTVKQGPLGLYQPTSYPVLMWSFSQLKGILEIDPRIAQGNVAEMQMIINDKTNLVVLRWFIDIFVEHTESNIRLTGDEIMTEIMMKYILEHDTMLDIRSIDVGRFRILLRSIDSMKIRYGDREPRDFYAPEFSAELSSRIIELDSLLRTDTRSVESEN